jgi:beta-lactam-binding protein with PASTA domain
MSRGVATFLVAAFVSALLFAYSQQSKSGRDTHPRVPFLEGQELAAARKEVGDTFKLTKSEQNSMQPEGTILAQRPEAGSKIQRGEKVSVVVSAGPRRVEVPRVVGQPLAEAVENLTSDGFEVSVKTSESPEQENGKVMAQSPSDGKADRGSEVEITVGLTGGGDSGGEDSKMSGSTSRTPSPSPTTSRTRTTSGEDSKMSRSPSRTPSPSPTTSRTPTTSQYD